MEMKWSKIDTQIFILIIFILHLVLDLDMEALLSDPNTPKIA